MVCLPRTLHLLPRAKVHACSDLIAVSQIVYFLCDALVVLKHKLCILSLPVLYRSLYHLKPILLLSEYLFFHEAAFTSIFIWFATSTDELWTLKVKICGKLKQADEHEITLFFSSMIGRWQESIKTKLIFEDSPKHILDLAGVQIFEPIITV